MPTIAIVGAGPGLGLAIAKVFGGNGFRVALIARDQSKLDGLAAQLGEAGIEAAGFAGDVLDRPSLHAALEAAAAKFGPIDVLEYSPAPHTAAPTLAMANVLDVTPENLQPQLEYYLYGAVAAAKAVLPGMLTKGAGTLLFTTGAGSVNPIPPMGNVNAAAAALRNWVLNLHNALVEKGIYAAHVPISAWIGSGAPAAEADVIAQTYWDLYTGRTEAERLYTA